MTNLNLILFMYLQKKKKKKNCTVNILNQSLNGDAASSIFQLSV